MYEELSRLLAGELDAASEAALRARIAADPSLAQAWASMSALPDLLGGLSFEAPPPALAARLSAQVDASMDCAEDPLEHELDAADPRDSADDTLDPEVTAARHPARARAMARAPASASGREAFLDELLANARTSVPPLVLVSSPTRAPAPVRSVAAPARPTGRGRHVGVTVFVAAMALAAGLVLGLKVPDAPLAPAAPAAVAISEGTTTVDGVVEVHAGGVQVRVDGRARVTVSTDSPVAALDTVSGPEGPLVVLQGTDSPATALADRDPDSPRSIADHGGAGGLTVNPSASAARTAGGWSRGATAATSQPGRFVVTVQVERGSAVIGADGTSVAIEAGESHTLSPPAIVASRPVSDNGGGAGPVVVKPGPGVTTTDEHQSVARRNPILDGSVAPSGAGPEELDGGDPIAVALEAVPGAEIIDFDCSERPCVAIFDYTGDDPAWGDALAAAMAEELDAAVQFTEAEVEVEGEVVELVAVAFEKDKEPGAHRAEGDHRARAALADVSRELTE